VGFHPLKTNREKDPSPRRSRAKKSEENLEKILRTCYLCSLGMRDFIEIVVQLVNMEKGFVWFPTIACLSKTCPTDSKFHSGALVPVATVAVDCFNRKILVHYDGRRPKVLFSLGHS